MEYFVYCNDCYFLIILNGFEVEWVFLVLFSYMIYMSYNIVVFNQEIWIIVICLLFMVDKVCFVLIVVVSWQMIFMEVFYDLYFNEIIIIILFFKYKYIIGYVNIQ